MAYLEYEKEHEIEILLCSAMYYEGIIHKICASQVYILSDQTQVREGDKTKCIFKFQSTEEIMKEIMDLYQIPKQPFLVQRNQETEIIGIVSPSGGNFCSTFAITVSAIYAKKKKTLLISFDPFLDMECIGISSQLCGISEAVYFLRQDLKIEDVIVDIETVIGHTNGVDYLLGCMHWADLTEISGEEAKKLLDVLSGIGEYERIIVDIGIFCRASAQLLSNCNILYEPYFGTRAEERKEQEWKRQFRMNNKEMAEKIQRVYLPYDKVLETGEYSFEELTKGTFGLFVKEFLEQT